MKDIKRDELGAPKIVDRSTFQAELDALRVREKAHTREGDAIAARSSSRKPPRLYDRDITPAFGRQRSRRDSFETSGRREAKVQIRRTVPNDASATSANGMDCEVTMRRGRQRHLSTMI
jgi:hypothetical protein